eukprot:11618223-Ditylum_brightwellii.AAC.1
MQLVKVHDFDVSGTIHIVVNNHIGFMTNPVHSCSMPYCLDVGNTFGAPILHCNGDDLLAVYCAMEMSMECCHEWGSDVIVDMICYGHLGHNELDQPLFAQPKLYKAIA